MKKGALLLVVIFLLYLTYVGSSENKVDDIIEEKFLEGNEQVKIIVVLKEETRRIGIQSVDSKNIISSLTNEFEKKHEFSSFNGFSGEITKQGLEELKKNKNVERIEYDYPIRAFLQDSIKLINASLVHNLDYGFGNITGRDQTICIIDTGINYTHQDLGNCALTNNINDASCNKVIGGYDYVNNDNNPMDDNGHGTHVAGIAAANGSLVGIAPEAYLVSIKVLNDNGNGYISHIISGIEWCTDNSTLFNISIISMSLGTDSLYSSICDDNVTSLTTVINNAVANNITIVAASGNNGDINGISMPACIENVTAIGSVTKSDEISSFSNRNSLVELFAPGSDINSTYLDGGYYVKDGTSMSTPHVAGVIALLKQYYDDIDLGVSVSKIIQELKETGKTIFDSETNLTFYRIDAYNSLNDTSAPKINITLSANSLDLNQQNLTITVSVSDAFLDSYNSNVTYPNGILLADFTDSINLTTENLTEVGNYQVMVFANDTNGNENITSETFLVRDTTGLNANSFTFHVVEDNNFSATNFIEFNVSIGSKYNLTNATLYHNLSEWHANYTYELNENETNLLFNSTFPEGIYLWRIGACDLNNYCADSENKTLYIDQSDPIVNLYNPINSTTKTTLPFKFSFNVSDYGIISCSLIINDTVNETLTSGISLTANTEFSNIYLANGEYNWSINCSDNVNKVGSSEEWQLTMSCSESWTCTDWSPSTCPESQSQTRTCNDANNCGTTTNKSSLTQSCTYTGNATSDTSSPASSTGSAETTTPETQSILKFSAEAGATKTFGISKDVGITGLELELKNAINNAEITLTKQEEKPSEVSALDNVYKYIKISSNILEDDLKEAKIKFKVEKSWISVNAKSVNHIFLQRYSDNKWDKLETLTAGEIDEYQNYIAVTPGFSYFAINAEKEVSVGEITTLEDVLEENESITNITSTTKEKTGFNIFKIFSGMTVKDMISKEALMRNKYILIVVFIIMVLIVLFRKKLSYKKSKKEKKSEHDFRFGKKDETEPKKEVKKISQHKLGIGAIIKKKLLVFEKYLKGRKEKKKNEKEEKISERERLLKEKEKELAIKEKDIIKKKEEEEREQEKEEETKKKEEEKERKRKKEEEKKKKFEIKTDKEESWEDFDLDADWDEGV